MRMEMGLGLEEGGMETDMRIELGMGVEME